MWNLRGNLQTKRGFFEFVENVTSPLFLNIYFSWIYSWSVEKLDMFN
jgi:hypothetical protein